MSCKHDDEIIDKTIMESAYEQARDTLRKIGGGNTGLFFRKKLVILLKCKKCKRVEKIVETNP